MVRFPPFLVEKVHSGRVPPDDVGREQTRLQRRGRKTRNPLPILSLKSEVQKLYYRKKSIDLHRKKQEEGEYGGLERCTHILPFRETLLYTSRVLSEPAALSSDEREHSRRRGTRKTWENPRGKSYYIKGPHRFARRHPVEVEVVAVH